MAKMASIPPGKENIGMLSGEVADVHPADNDQEHIISHSKFLELLKNNPGIAQSSVPYIEHIKRHRKQEQMKAQQSQQGGGIAQMQQGQPGPEGSAIANTPVPSGAPSMPQGAVGAGAMPNA
jgi:hypothetical protein